MVRVNNLASDATSDQAKATPEAPSFASPIDLFKSDNSCFRGGSLPRGFDNNFSINGLDTGKGTGLKLIDNMPVLRFDSKGFDDNMPVLRFDGKGFDDNMPILRPNPDLSISDDIPGSGPPDLGITDDIPGCGSFIDLGIPDDFWGMQADRSIGNMPVLRPGDNSGPTDNMPVLKPENGALTDRMPVLRAEETAPTDAAAKDATLSRPRGSDGYGQDTTSRGSGDALPALPLEGKSILELDPKINPRLGCALAVSGALHELDPSFPITNNNKQLAQLLKQHGYEAVPQDGALKNDSVNPGDVLIGQRPDGMPGHAAIYKGQGKIYENNSDTGTIIGDGSLDRFNDKMHDTDGRWNKNGFSDVMVYRKVPVVGMANY